MSSVRGPQRLSRCGRGRSARSTSCARSSSVARRQLGIDRDGQVDERRLVGHAPGRRAVMRRGVASSVTSLPSRTARPPRSSVAAHVADIAAETEQRVQPCAALPDCGHDAQRLHGLGHVVHAHDVGAVEHGHHVAGDRAAERSPGLDGDTASMKRLRDSPIRIGRPKHRQFREPRDHRRCSAPASCRSRCRDRARCARARCRPSRRCRASARKTPCMSAMMSSAGSAVSRLCITITGTPCSAATRAMSGSRCRPHTSLRIAAPCSSAQAATFAFMVSIETGRPSRRSAAEHRRRGARVRRRARPAARRHRAGSNSAPTSRMSAPSADHPARMRDRDSRDRRTGRRRRRSPA